MLTPRLYRCRARTSKAFLWRGAHLVYFHHSDLKKSYYVQMASSGENQVLIATTQAIPGA